MKKFFIVIIFTLASCLNELPTEPGFTTLNVMAISLPISMRSMMNGIYKVNNGNDLLGDEVVGRWINDTCWCLYSTHDVVYSKNKCSSIKDSTFEFAGYIRIIRSGTGTNIDLNILSSDGGTELLSGNTPSSIIFKGTTATGSNIELRRIRDSYRHTDTTKVFNIIGHRGGGRNAERLDISENSIEMIKYAEILGATGVEIDVKKTRDGKIILFHDDTFSPRTVKGTYLLGKVENFDLVQIQTFGRLYYGEAIPTLEEALIQIIEETTLSLVWIDVKDPEIVNKVMAIQKAAMVLAFNNNRIIDILLGIPDEEILYAYNSSSIEKTPVLIEFDRVKALTTESCKVWAPRWTNGIPSSGEIESFHTKNKLVFTWTLDVKEFIEDFVHNSQIDGILSNYPSQVMGIYFTKE